MTTPDPDATVILTPEAIAAETVPAPAPEPKRRFGIVVKAVAGIAILAALGLGVRAALPDHLRHEVDDAFRRPFLPHLQMPIQMLEATTEQDIVDELTKHGFDVTCYDGLSPAEKISSRDERRCWTLLKTAFDDIPARSLNLWFQGGRLSHARFEFPAGVLSRVHEHLDKVLDDQDAQHIRKQVPLGKDTAGNPLMSWFAGNGFITVNGKENKAGNNLVLWTSWVANAPAILPADTGTYSVIRGDTKQMTDMAVYVYRQGSYWAFEDRQPDGSWAPMPCKDDCYIKPMAPDVVTKLFPKTVLINVVPSCVGNGSLAFCKLAGRTQTDKQGYMLIGAPSAAKPVLLLARKVSDRKEFPELDQRNLPSPMAINPRQRT